MNNIIGKPIDRVDARLKVTGQATYAAEFEVDNVAYGVTVQSTVSNGSIANIDTSIAENIAGVIKIITYKNALQLKKPDPEDKSISFKLGETILLPLQDNAVYYNGQHIAIVVAESFEIAEYAATQIKITYNADKPIVEIEDDINAAYQPKASLTGSPNTEKGNIAEAGLAAAVKVEQTYTTPVYHHNAMEPHATLAVWKDDELTVYDSTQNVIGSRDAIAYLLDVPKEKVHLLSPFIGGGFGSKGFVWPHSVLAPMAAKIAGRPVKMVLDRQQMFTSNGHRARTIQNIMLAANDKGKLLGTKHETITETSAKDEFVETCGVATAVLYANPTLSVNHKLVRVNKGTPCPTRAPGEATGTFAMECAMDELAYKLNIDPVELRMINHADKSPKDGKAWSSKHLLECYTKGAELIGWYKRNPKPASMKEGRLLVGYGMATGIYAANRSKASAKVQILADGNAIGYSCTQDIGTGTYTVMTQIIAECVGLPVEKVAFKLGDSSLPKSPGSGGSQSSASTGGAVRAAALEAKSKLIQMAIADEQSPLYNHKEDDVVITNGVLNIAGLSLTDSYKAILMRNNLPMLEAEATTDVSTREAPEGGGEKKPEQLNRFAKEDESIDRKKYAFWSFSAMFAKVLVDPDTCKVKVDRLVSVLDIGTVLNHKTATNQIMGGMLFALGMALMEETVYDHTTGRPITRDLANYLVPVHADVPEFTIEFLNKPDHIMSPIGSRGIGEIGITGTTAGIVNAIYHATGTRVRNLPVTPDKLLYTQMFT